MTKIGINGFGRLGRQLLKIAIDSCKKTCGKDSPKVVMVNDAHLNSECLAMLSQKDSFYGKYNADIVQVGAGLMVDGQRVDFTTEHRLDKIPWSKSKVDYVIDTTGQNTSCEKASMLLTEGVKRVITTGCSKVPIFIVGVNHCCFDLDMKVVSAATPQMNCLLPLLRVLHENFNIVHATALAIHPLNEKCKFYDDHNESSNCRLSRSAWFNIVPMEPQCKSIDVARIIPELENKIHYTAVKVPVPCVGAIDITAKFSKDAPYNIVISKIKHASDNHMKGILGCSNEDLVSSDIIGSCNSGIVDIKAGLHIDKCISKYFVWYDREYSFANRIYDLAKYISSREDCPKS